MKKINCDESAFYLCPDKNKVIVKKGVKVVHNFINGDEKECITYHGQRSWYYATSNGSLRARD